MDGRSNPLFNIDDINTCQMVMQLSAWMSSIVVFEVSATVHAVFLAGVLSLSAFSKQQRADRGSSGLSKSDEPHSHMVVDSTTMMVGNLGCWE